MVKNTPSNAGDAGSIPGWGTKIPHAMGQLSLCASTREPVCRKLQSPRALEHARSGACAPQLENPVCHNEEPTHRNERSCMPQQISCMLQLRPNAAKNKNKKTACWDFPGGAVVKNLPANAEDTGSSPCLGRSHMPWSN